MVLLVMYITLIIQQLVWEIGYLQQQFLEAHKLEFSIHQPFLLITSFILEVFQQIILHH